MYRVWNFVAWAEHIAAAGVVAADMENARAEWADEGETGTMK